MKNTSDQQKADKKKTPGRYFINHQIMLEMKTEEMVQMEKKTPKGRIKKTTFIVLQLYKLCNLCPSARQPKTNWF